MIQLEIAEIKIRKLLKSKRTFSATMGYGAPFFLVGNVLIGFWQHWAFGLVSLLIMGWFAWHTTTNVCCRCPHYGSRTCLSSQIVPKFLSAKPSGSLSLARIRFQYWADLGIAAYTIFCYSFLPTLLPIVILGTLAAIILVYIPRRHHGLFHRLRGKSNSTD